MNTRRMCVAALALATCLSGAAQAALYDRGGGLIYDSDLNVTWLQDANYAKTSGYDADGQMDWYQATTWAANLSYYDSVRNVTYTDWRLPTVNPVNGSSFNASLTYNGSSDIGYNISAPGTAYAGSTSSEMAHLFYSELNNKGYYDTAGAGPQAGWGLVNKGPFTNILSFTAYWSGTAYAPDTSHALVFHFNYGYQDQIYKTFTVPTAWAVRDGDVATVPEADTWVMLLAGLGLVSVAARRRRG